MAIVVQDLDGMGRFLGDGPPDGGLTYGWHGTVSDRLSALAGDQLAALRGPSRWAVPVYAGGDDLLAFVAAQSALDVARECHRLVPLDLPSATGRVPQWDASLDRLRTKLRLTGDGNGSQTLTIDSFEAASGEVGLVLESGAVAADLGPGAGG